MLCAMPASIRTGHRDRHGPDLHEHQQHRVPGKRCADQKPGDAQPARQTDRDRTDQRAHRETRRQIAEAGLVGVKDFARHIGKQSVGQRKRGQVGEERDAERRAHAGTAPGVNNALLQVAQQRGPGQVIRRRSTGPADCCRPGQAQHQDGGHEIETGDRHIDETDAESREQSGAGQGAGNARAVLRRTRQG